MDTSQLSEFPEMDYEDDQSQMSLAIHSKNDLSYSARTVSSDLNGPSDVRSFSQVVLRTTGEIKTEHVKTIHL